MAGILGIGLGLFLGFVREYSETGEDEEKEKMGRAQLIFLKGISDLIPKKIKQRMPRGIK